MDWEANKAKFVNHFLWMATLDRAYARSALTEYLAIPNCPHPDMREAVRAEWERRRECS